MTMDSAPILPSVITLQLKHLVQKMLWIFKIRIIVICIVSHNVHCINGFVSCLVSKDSIVGYLCSQCNNFLCFPIFTDSLATFIHFFKGSGVITVISISSNGSWAKICAADSLSFLRNLLLDYDNLKTFWKHLPPQVDCLFCTLRHFWLVLTLIISLSNSIKVFQPELVLSSVSNTEFLSKI